MPLAFKNAGILLGTIGLWLMAFICTYCIHILLKSYKHVTRNDNKKEEIERQANFMGYDDVVYLMLKEKYGPNSKV